MRPPCLGASTALLPIIPYGCYMLGLCKNKPSIFQEFRKLLLNFSAARALRDRTLPELRAIPTMIIRLIPIFVYYLRR